MQMDDEVAHRRIVDGPLGGGLPGGMRRGIVGIDADDIERRQVAELMPSSEVNSPPKTRCSNCFFGSWSAAPMP